MEAETEAHGRGQRAEGGGGGRGQRAEAEAETLTFFSPPSHISALLTSFSSENVSLIFFPSFYFSVF